MITNIWNSPDEEFIHDLIASGRSADPVIARLISINDNIGQFERDFKIEFEQRFGSGVDIDRVAVTIDELELEVKGIHEENRELQDRVKYLETRNILQVLTDMQSEMDTATTQARLKQDRINLLLREKELLRDKLETWTILAT